MLTFLMICFVASFAYFIFGGLVQLLDLEDYVPIVDPYEIIPHAAMGMLISGVAAATWACIFALMGL